MPVSVREVRQSVIVTEAASLFVFPMAAESVSNLPEGEDWLYEVKLDGYRALLIKDGNRVQLRSRNNKELTRMYPGVSAEAPRLNADRAVIDGELVALGPDGKPSFQALQHRERHPDYLLVFYCFDLLHVNGVDITQEPLLKRRACLRGILGRDSALRLSEELPGAAAQIVEAVRAAGLEGIMAKRKYSRYQPGVRSADWLKFKLERQQEFVIGGYRSIGSRVDALLIGYYEGRELRFAGKVRAGMVPHVRRELFNQCAALQVTACPFVNLPDAKSSRWGGGVTADDMSKMHWIRPKLVVQVHFVEWTAEGRLRHSVFMGLRDDKRAGDVRKEY